MNERERIIAILNEAHLEYYSHMDFTKTYIEAVADHLLANGVTVSEEVEELQADNRRLCEMWAKAVSDLSKVEASLIKAQRWIPVTEWLPTKEDANHDGMVFAIHKEEGYGWPWLWEIVANRPEKFTHWQPIPEPPKEEE